MNANTNVNAYSLSRYVFIIPGYLKPQKDLWVDLVTGKKIVVPGHFKPTPSSLEKLPEKIFELMSRHFLIVSSEADTARGLDFLRSFRCSSKTVHFTINTTNRCNCDCSYCYNSPSEQTYSPSKDGNDIPVLTQFIMYTLRQIGAEHLDVCFSGGEPLLYPGFVIRLSQSLRDNCLKENINYTADVITNGTLLTPNIAKSLRESGVHSLQVTLDGLSNRHNQRRPLKNGNNSYQKVMEGINAGCAQLDIHIRCHIHKDDEDWIFPFLQQLPVHIADHKRITAAPASIDPTPHTPIKARMLCLSYEERAKRFPLIWEEIEKLGFQPDSIFSTAFLCSGNRQHSFTVTPDGNLFKCMCSGAYDSWLIGSISRGIQWNKVNSLIDNMLKSECQYCRFLPICAGGCPLNLDSMNSCPEGLKRFLQVSLEYDFRRNHFFPINKKIWSLEEV